MFVCVVDDGQGLQILYSTTATLSMKIAIAPTHSTHFISDTLGYLLDSVCPNLQDNWDECCNTFPHSPKEDIKITNLG